MITPYIKSSYNCSQHAVRRINEIHGTDINWSAGEEWQPSFLSFLRSKMERIQSPKNGCLVVMTQIDNSLHLGVYNNYHVEHNFKPNDSAGQVIKSDMGVIRSLYKNVRYYYPKVQ